MTIIPQNGLKNNNSELEYNKNIVDCIKKLETCFYNSEHKEWEVPLTAFSELVDRCCEFDEPSARHATRSGVYEVL